MNGAELPSGHIMGVQPAQMDYYSKTKESMKNVEHVEHIADSSNDTIDEASISISGAAAMDAGVVPLVLDSSNNNDVMIISDAKKTPIEEEDDLDDFFASLE